MKLITKSIVAKLPMTGDNPDEGDRARVWLKLFTPWANWTWYVTEYDPDTGEAFGLVNGFEKELGYFNLGEIAALKGPFGLTVERDLYWSDKTTLGEARTI